jgi:1-acyl-sn-glycerol-3-phosphate acyltransferase
MSTSKKFIGTFYGNLALLILVLTTILGSIPILVLGLLKLLPNQNLKVYCTKIVDKIATVWVEINKIYIDKSNPTHMEITGASDFNAEDWYLVVANHQSWLDIVILQQLLNRKIPVLKFFIKDQLKWIPFLGFSWWAMGCPFMKRYTPAYLAKNPHKKGKDLQATQKALKLFQQTPVSLMSFVEGTRFTPQKKLDQQSPYQHLLKPKAGGIGFVISAMNKRITKLIDITITYPKQESTLWDFLCHRIDTIKINIRQIPIPQEFLTTSLAEDDKIQSEFRQWLNQKWLEKDALITTMKGL